MSKVMKDSCAFSLEPPLINTLSGYPWKHHKGPGNMSLLVAAIPHLWFTEIIDLDFDRLFLAFFSYFIYAACSTKEVDAIFESSKKAQKVRENYDFQKKISEFSHLPPPLSRC
jgi:hypothetical protein